MAKKKEKSVAPSGLTIARDWEKFTFSWKIAKKGYGDGQNFQYAKGSGWENVNVGKTTKSKEITISRSNFHPNSGKGKISAIKFRVRGNTKKYTTGSGKNKKTHSPAMSEWSEKSFPITTPGKPSITTEVLTWPQVKFTWKTGNEKDKSDWFTRVEYTSVLVQDSDITQGKDINWSNVIYRKTEDQTVNDSKTYYKIQGGKYVAVTPAGTENPAESGWYEIKGQRYNSTSGSAESSITVTEDSELLADGHSYTRWFRVRAQGPAGNSDYSYAKHVYAMANQCVITKTEVTPSKDVSGYTAKVWFNSPFADSRPITEAKIQYALATPAAGMECPDGASWQDAGSVKIKDGTSGALFSIDSLVGLDQVVFVRVNAEYDGRTTYGEPVSVDVGKLKKPTITNVTTDGSTYKATITATNNSDVPDSFLVVRYMDADDPDGFDIALIPHGSTQAIGVQCPQWTSAPRFGVYAVAPADCYEETEREDGIGSYAVDPEMQSDMATDGGAIPAAPEDVTATPAQQTGAIRVTWKWSWEDADTAELSWADHEDAWESTSEPQTYNVSKMYSSAWNISGLETGKKWYVRVRLIKTTADGQTFGAYSDTIPVDLSSAPLIPVITLSDAVIPPDGQVTANWVYSTTDGTAQSFAEIAEKVEDEQNPGEFTYNTIAQVESAQHITLDAQELGWQAGESHNLVVRVTSASGHTSDDWSAARTVIVAEPPTCEIAATSLETVEIETTDEEGDPVTLEITALTEMPFTCTVTGAGDSGKTAIAIERAAAYHVDRPDETDYNGYEGETIASDSHVGEDPFTITVDDLKGHLDDSAQYRLVATVTDGLGQTAKASIDFTVEWAHQASAPTATVEIDAENSAAILTPIAPEDADPTDVCDIYRLSIDMPQLVYSGATFGQTYVDPYPAIGRYGGHRFVTRTANGDVTTPDGSFAWEDYGEDDGDTLVSRYNIFEFEKGTVLLELDVDISNQWKKDFKETQYLGGSTQGDWNKAVGRSGAVGGVAIPGRDDELIQAMRRLADMAGICHLRTKDGSSYAANVDVSDKYVWENGIEQYVYSLSITRVKPQELDGMTLEEWQETHEEESE